MIFKENIYIFAIKTVNFALNHLNLVVLLGFTGVVFLIENFNLCRKVSLFKGRFVVYKVQEIRFCINIYV